MKTTGALIVALLICATVVSGALPDACAEVWECLATIGEEDSGFDCLTKECYYQQAMAEFARLYPVSLDVVFDLIEEHIRQIKRDLKEMDRLEVMSRQLNSSDDADPFELWAGTKA